MKNNGWLTESEQLIIRAEVQRRLNFPDPAPLNPYSVIQQRQALFAIVGLEMGLRVSEIAELNLENFDTDHNRATVTRCKKKGPGYKKHRRLSGVIRETMFIRPYMSRLIEHLKLAWQRDSGPLFVNGLVTFSETFRVEPRTLRKDWMNFQIALGLPVRGTHVLRRTFATEIAYRTRDPLLVNLALGHSPKSIAISAAYVSRNPKRLERAMQTLYQEE